MNLRRQAVGIGALADDTRRALYEYVVSQTSPVGREQAATALGIARHNVSFHLDRLVSDGLLETEFRRLSGRSGPGAGRPTKLYRRSTQEFAVTLPPRRYDVVGAILVAAIAGTRAGLPLQQALQQAAYDEGRAVGRAAEPAIGAEPIRTLTRLLTSQGYQPTVDGETVVLTNCPFDSLAQRDTALVCGLNRDFVQGVAEGLDSTGLEACLEPEAGRCCVKVRIEHPPDGTRPEAPSS